MGKKEIQQNENNIITKINHKDPTRGKSASGEITSPPKVLGSVHKIDMQIHTLAPLLKASPFLGGILTACDLAVAMAAACVSNNKVLCVVR